MVTSDDNTRRFWSPQMFVFLLLLAGAAALFGSVILFNNAISGRTANVLIGVGIAIGPAALLSILYRLFLLDDVRNELLSPLKDIEERTSRAVEEKVKEGFTPILSRVELLGNLERLGVEYVYDSRESALRPDTSFFKSLREERRAYGLSALHLEGCFKIWSTTT